jgi:hypothetical protein
MPHNPTAPPPRAALAVPTRWPVPPLIQASVGLHVAAAGAVWLVPGAWPWAAGAVVANHLALTAAGLWPRSRLLGPNITRLPEAAAARGEIAITIDDGPDPQVTPATLDLLARLGVRATFFCIAERARAHPALMRRILDAATASATTAAFTATTFRCWGRGASNARSPARRTCWPMSAACGPCSFAPRPACATRCSTRCCTAWACTW